MTTFVSRRSRHSVAVAIEKSSKLWKCNQFGTLRNCIDNQNACHLKIGVHIIAWAELYAGDR